MLKITYLFDSTTLWGGTRVALEQTEALSEAGYDIRILSKDKGPDWYPLKLPVTQVSGFDSSTIPASDIIVGTFWPTVRDAYKSGRGLTVHLCQGYEGSYKEYSNIKHEIDEVYSLKIPKLTVSQHLNNFLSEKFNADTYYVGQMLDRDIFYTSKNRQTDSKPAPLNILVIGPFEGSFKNIPTTLKGIKLASKKLKESLKLTRVSQFPLSYEEESIIKPDVYHHRVPYPGIGDIYRASDIFISMSTEEEGFGLPALEAMACGIPTILSRIPSYLGFDDTQEFAIFVESTPEAVSEAIKRLYKNVDLRRSLSKKGLSVAKKFTKESVLSRLTGAFEKIM